VRLGLRHKQRILFAAGGAKVITMVPSTSHPPNPAPFSVEVGSSNRRSSYATCCYACGRVGTGRFTVRNWLDRHPKRFHRDSRKRTKKCIATVYRYLDLDTDGEAHLASLRDSDAVPTPNAILSTSLGKYQVLWRVDGNTFEQQESTPKLFAIPFGGDPACTDCNRVLRLPGFPTRKYAPAHFVTVQCPRDSTRNPDDFRLDIPAANVMLLPRSIPPRKHPDKHTNSEPDWAWFLHELAHGKGAAKLTRTLASRQALLRSSAGNCANGAEDDCPEKDCLIQHPLGEQDATT
jgi:RepB DNA-primase from phage plasmid